MMKTEKEQHSFPHVGQSVGEGVILKQAWSVVWFIIALQPHCMGHVNKSSSLKDE